MVTVASAVAVAACGGTSEPALPPHSRIVVVQRPTTTDHDSVFSQLPGVLRVVVYDSSGHPAPNAILMYQIISATPTPPPTVAEFVFWARSSLDPPTAWVPVSGRFGMNVKADGEGGVSLAIKYGAAATTVRLEIRSATAGLAQPETLSFAIRAARPVRFAPTPRDTAVYVGRSYTLSTALLDAYGNAAADPGPRLKIVSDSSATTVSSTGVVTGHAIGRSLIHLSVDSLRDSVWTSVVPTGTMAAVRAQPNFALLQVAFDGSGLFVLTPRRVDFPAWSPGGDRVAFTDYSTLDDYGGRIIVRDIGTGAERPLVGRYTPYQDYQTSPTFSADGAWVYYAGGASRLPSVIRGRTDGTAQDTLAVPPAGPAPYDPTNLYLDSAYIGYAAPVPSPSNRYVAYTGMSPCCVGWAMWVQDLVNRTRVKIIDHELPRWIPGSDLLVAHGHDGFDIYRPDGTRLRGIPYTTMASPFVLSYDVSPDGHWLLAARGSAGFELVNLESGMRLPLAFTASWSSPAWKP